MKRLSILLLFVTGSLLSSCNNDKTTPGYVYMDDMYTSPSLETYEPAYQFSNGLSAQLPVEGTVARGYHPYEYPDSDEGYDSAKVSLTMPEKFNSEDALSEGKELYTTFCVHCHGEKGDGNGILVEQDKFPSPGAYKGKDITPGSMYHVIMHGKNLMGSHASQLTYDERWKIVRYVVKLREDQE